MKRYLPVILVFIIFLTPALFSAEKVTIAVLDITGKGVSKAAANTVSDIIRSEFVNIANFTVVERSQINAVLKEQGLQQTGCTDSSCAIQAGKLLSARKIVVGEINRIGTDIVITVRYVDVELGSSLFSASNKSKGLEEVTDAARKLSKKLAEKIISGDKDVIIPKTVGGYYLRGLVPGWGQFYSGHRMKGYFYSISFLVSGALTGAAFSNYMIASKNYDNLTSSDTIETIKKRRDDCNTAMRYMNISLGVIGGVYLINLIDIFFFSRNSLEEFLISKTTHDKPGVYATVNSYYVMDTVMERKFEFIIGLRF